MRRFCSIVLIAAILFFASPLHAACTGGGTSCTKVGATYTCTDASYGCIQDACTASTAGDTINITDTTGRTWATTLAVTKGVYLIGPGKTNLTITHGIASHAALITYYPADYSLDTPFRVSGFTFDLNNNGRGIELNSVEATAPQIQTAIRIDNNAFLNSATYSYHAIYNHGAMYGVIDNNTFTDVWYPLRNDGAAVNSSWWDTYDLLAFGGSDNLYFEDNTLTGLGTIATACQYGARYSMRYNSFSYDDSGSAFFDLHGNSGTGMESCFGAEVYGNQMTSSVGNTNLSMYDARGAKSLVFYNTAITTGTFSEGAARTIGCPANHITDQLVNNTYVWSNRKNTTAASSGFSQGAQLNCDGAPAANPTVNRDFFADTGETPGITCGSGDPPGTCSVGQGYWKTSQSCSDLTGMVGASPATEIAGTLYKCTSTDTWESYYTPYNYPHPLRDIDSGPTVTAFTLPENADNLSVAVSSFTCTDNVAVTGYCIALTNSSTGCGWSGSAQGTVIFSAEGAQSAYAFCKDAAGNISVSATDSVTITLPSGSGGQITGLGTGSASMSGIGTGSATMTIAR